MIKRTGQKKVYFSVGIFTQGGTLSDEIGPFDSYEAAAQEMEFYKRFYAGGGYKFKIIKNKVTVLFTSGG